MNRNEQLKKHLDREMCGIEIGPWCHPVVPKSEGYNCLVMDVFDTETLKERAKVDLGSDDAKIDCIEEVDVLSTCSCIAENVKSDHDLGTFDYILSSHNFEHLPDPITFLQGCSKVLKPDGILSMAIPDKRGCFDLFRPHSTVAQMLSAFFEKRERPTHEQIFERWAMHARKVSEGNEAISFPISTPLDEIVPFDSLKDAYDGWVEAIKEEKSDYVDTHCWVFAPSSFELIINDLCYFGLIDFQLVEIITGGGGEFVAHLQNSKDVSSFEDYPSARVKILHRIQREICCHFSRNSTLRGSPGISLFRRVLRRFI